MLSPSPTSSTTIPVTRELTLSTTTLKIGRTFTQSTKTDGILPTNLQHEIQIHSHWIERMGWNVDDPIIVCQQRPPPPGRVPGDPTDINLFTCCLMRLNTPDFTHGWVNWTNCNLSEVTSPTISFQSTIQAEAWAACSTVPFEECMEEEQRERETYLFQLQQEQESATPTGANTMLKSPLKTPVKTKPTIMQLPSHFAKSPPAPSAASPANLQATLAAAARLFMKVETIEKRPSRLRLGPAPSTILNPSATDGSIYLLSLRPKTVPIKATRIILQPLATESDSKSSISKEDELELAGMVKRFLQRCYVCSNAIIDVRSLTSPQLQAWKYLRVKEINPEGEICQITRATTFILDSSPPSANSIGSPFVNSALLAAAIHSTQETAKLHPALVALHSLLLPPLLYPQAFRHLKIDTPKGLLLRGPPGVGKTFSVSAVCQSLQIELFCLDGASVYGSGEGVAGAAEEVLRQKFKEAQACTKPAVLFIDEIDVLCPHRTNEAAQLSNRLVAQLLSLMDGLENRGHLLIVGATNHPNSLDAALRRPGRFDRELRIDPPTVEQRLNLLETYTKTMPIAPEVNLRQLASSTIGYVAADLAALVREAAQHALTQYIKSPAFTTGATSALPPSIGPADFEAAHLLVPASSLRGNGTLASKPTTTFDSIGGLMQVKQELQRALTWPMMYQESFQRLGLKPPRGILLYGPPGCAKTSLVRAIAGMSSAAFLPLDTAQLYSCYFGEAERILRNLFIRARANRPCVIFLDEIDAMVSKRDMTGGGGNSGGGSNSLEARILSTLLNEMDGMVSSQGLLVVAATNRLEMIDDALLRPGRFDKIIYVPPPDAASRFDILRLQTRKMLFEPDSTETLDALRQLADELDGYTGADLTNLCRETAMTVLRRNMQQEKVLVSDLVAMAHSPSSKPSLTADMMERYAAAGRMKKMADTR